MKFVKSWRQPAHVRGALRLTGADRDGETHRHLHAKYTLPLWHSTGPGVQPSRHTATIAVASRRRVPAPRGCLWTADRGYRGCSPDVGECVLAPGLSHRWNRQGKVIAIRELSDEETNRAASLRKFSTSVVSSLAAAWADLTPGFRRSPAAISIGDAFTPQYARRARRNERPGIFRRSISHTT
jgi:hypothetical protein